MSDKEQYYEYIKLQWDFIKRNLDGDRTKDEFWSNLIDDANKTIDSVPQQDREYVKKCILAVMGDFERKRKNG